MLPSKPSAALIDLAKEIDVAIHTNGGRLEAYCVLLERFHGLMQDQAEYFGGYPIALPYDRVNFVWRGLAVYAAPETGHG